MQALFQRFARTFKKGDIIFCEHEPGDNFYLIQTGRVQIVKIMGEIEKIVDILNPGEIFGEMAMLEEAPRSATAIALDDVEAFEFNKENFELLLKGNPQIALILIRLFAKRIYDQKRRLMILTLKDPEAKVADVFIMLGENTAPEEGQTEIEINTKVEDIAHWAGMDPAKCKEIISRFIAQGKIAVFPEKIIVKEMKDLVRLVNARRKPKEK